MNQKTLKIAMGELGVKERLGSKHNQRILEYHQATSGKFGTDEVPWCSSFVNWVMDQANLPRTNNAMARSWLNIGSKTSSPEPGDVVIFYRGNKNSSSGHVAFFVGYSSTGKSVYCLGGNQNNEVNISRYPKYKVLGFRKPSKKSSPKPTGSLPSGYLRKGDSNSNVKLLQKALIKLKYLNDVADGVFGPKTETALKRFQKVAGITADGIYGSESRSALKSRL